MERMTVKRPDGRWAIANHDGASPTEQMMKIPAALDRLAAYENSDLEPEVLAEFAPFLRELHENLGAMRRLRELARADADGRAFTVPCKVGDMIFQLRGKKHARGVGISSRIVSCIEVHADGQYSVCHQGMTPCLSRELGETWFLTLEEAERKLHGGGAHA